MKKSTQYDLHSSNIIEYFAKSKSVLTFGQMAYLQSLNLLSASFIRP